MDARRTVETRLGPLAVRLLGEGPPAVLWHSLFVDERSWGRVENDLATQRRLVLITGPGHGASGDPDRRYTLDDCAEAAEASRLRGLLRLGCQFPPRWDSCRHGSSPGRLDSQSVRSCR